MSNQSNAYRRLSYQLEQHKSGVRRLSRSDYRKAKREIAKFRAEAEDEYQEMWQEYVRAKAEHMTPFWHSGNSSRD